MDETEKARLVVESYAVTPPSLQAGKILHIAFTKLSLGESYGWQCRCGAEENDFTTRDEARKAGDRHLAKANGNG